MNKLLNKLNESIRNNMLYYFIVIILFFIGIVIGVYTIRYMSDGSRGDLSSYLNGFLSGSTDKDIEYNDLFFTVLKNNLILFVPIILFSFTRLGVFVIAIADIFKGFSIGYTFAFLSLAFNESGFLLASVSVIPQNILYIFAIVVLSAIGLSNSIHLIKIKINKNDNNFDKQMQFKNMFKNIALIGAVLVLGIIVETYLSPNIIKLVISRFYM